MNTQHLIEQVLKESAVTLHSKVESYPWGKVTITATMEEMDDKSVVVGDVKAVATLVKGVDGPTGGFGTRSSGREIRLGKSAFTWGNPKKAPYDYQFFIDDVKSKEEAVAKIKAWADKLFAKFA